MKKVLTLVMAAAVGLCLCSSVTRGNAVIAAERGAVTGNYEAHFGGYDWGTSVDKIILTLDNEIESIDKYDLSIKEKKQTTDFSDPSYSVLVSQFDRQVTDAYLCDEKGNKVSKPSKYVAVEMYVSPNDGSPLLFSMTTQFNTYSNPYELEVKLKDSADVTTDGYKTKSFNIEKVMSSKTTDADAFTTSTFKASDGVEYQYASYKPEKSSKVLVVWLHGLGEGGTENTDPYITTLANKVTSLAGEDFQSKFDGANILVPQCPTYWMDNDGKESNFNNGGITADGTSYYLDSLHELIDSYKEECGAEKVIIAGCSNGGYMTMLMAMNYSNEYSAYVPICEALPNKVITDEQLTKIKDLPIFFIYSLDDTTVVPSQHEEPTIERLRAMGASNLHVSTSDSVIDTSGNYKDDEGNPYKYMGHWSWVYFFNNQSNDNETGEDVWSWMAEQVK